MSEKDAANLLRQSAPVEDDRAKRMDEILKRQSERDNGIGTEPEQFNPESMGFSLKTPQETLDRLADEDAERHASQPDRKFVLGAASPPADIPHQCPYCPNPDRDSVAVRENGRLRGCQWKEDKRVSVGADPPCVCDNYGTRKGYPREFRSSAASTAPADVAGMREATVEYLANRFLAWKLPKSVCADTCATDKDYKFPRSGTNLLDFAQAKEMVNYLFAWIDLASVGNAESKTDAAVKALVKP